MINALLILSPHTYSGGLKRTVKTLSKGRTYGINYHCVVVDDGLLDEIATTELTRLSRTRSCSIIWLKTKPAKPLIGTVQNLALATKLRTLLKPIFREKIDLHVVPMEFWFDYALMYKRFDSKVPIAVIFQALPLPFIPYHFGAACPSLLCLLRGIIETRRDGLESYIDVARSFISTNLNMKMMGCMKGISIASVSKSLAKRMKASGIKRPINILNPGNGVDESLVSKLKREIGHNKELDVVFLSGPRPEKGVYDLLRAIQTLVKRRKKIPWMFHLFGFDKESKLQIEGRLRLLQIGQHVKVHGRLTKEEDVFRVLGSAKLLCHPSYLDSFSLTVLEALSMGTPVISYGIDSLFEVYGNYDSVVKVTPGNIDELAKTLYETLENIDQYSKISFKESTDVIKTFNWGNVVKSEKNFYDRVLKGI